MPPIVKSMASSFCTLYTLPNFGAFCGNLKSFTYLGFLTEERLEPLKDSSIALDADGRCAARSAVGGNFSSGSPSAAL